MVVEVLWGGLCENRLGAAQTQQVPDRSTTDPPQGMVEPTTSQVCGTSVETYLRKGKNATLADGKEEGKKKGKKKKRNNSANSKVRKEGREMMVEAPEQPVGKTTPE